MSIFFLFSLMVEYWQCSFEIPRHPLHLLQTLHSVGICITKISYFFSIHIFSLSINKTNLSYTTKTWLPALLALSSSSGSGKSSSNAKLCKTHALMKLAISFSDLNFKWYNYRNICFNIPKQCSITYLVLANCKL